MGCWNVPFVCGHTLSLGRKEKGGMRWTHS
jgi:hypothetical protein